MATGRGIIGTVIRGATDGLSVTAGQAVTNIVVSKIPFGQATPVGQNAMKLLVGVLGSMAVKKVTKSDRVAAFYLAGVTNDIYRKLFAGVPVVGAALSGFGTYPQLGTYPRQLRTAALHGWAGAPQGAALYQDQDSQHADDENDPNANLY